MAESRHSAFLVGGLTTVSSSASQGTAALDVFEGLFPAVWLDVGALFDDAHSRLAGCSTEPERCLGGAVSADRAGAKVGKVMLYLIL